MSASTSGGGPLSPQAAAALQEGIGLVFGRWTALQMAVENQWGGRDSRAKADQLAASILSWFANSKGPFYYDDLEDMMFDSMSDSFNTEVEDGSVGEVAKKLLEMHEECLQNNFSSIEKLRNTRPQGNAVSQSRQQPRRNDVLPAVHYHTPFDNLFQDVIFLYNCSVASLIATEDDDSSDDDDEPSMVENEAARSEDMAVDEPKPSKPTPDADGWTTVPPRHGRGKN